MEITATTNKSEVLHYFKGRATQVLRQAVNEFSETDYKKRAHLVNREIVETKKKLLSAVESESNSKGWAKQDLLRSVLLVTYCSYVSMLETRHGVWAYEYMTFARRIGELWEPFMKTCWEYSPENLELFAPPRFSDVKGQLVDEITGQVKGLKISETQKNELLSSYQKVWSFVTSGEIKLELDLHFLKGRTKYVVDFKSGFSSNEKGNTNRLLLVASIYASMSEGYQCLIFVRSPEDSNNHYLQTLKSSGLWQVYCAQEVKEKANELTGFDVKGWIEENIQWESDFEPEFYDFLNEKELTEYIAW